MNNIKLRFKLNDLEHHYRNFHKECIVTGNRFWTSNTVICEFEKVGAKAEYSVKEGWIIEFEDEEKLLLFKLKF